MAPSLNVVRIFRSGDGRNTTLPCQTANRVILDSVLYWIQTCLAIYIYIYISCWNSRVSSCSKLFGLTSAALVRVRKFVTNPWIWPYRQELEVS